MVAVMKAVEAVKKDRTNTQGATQGASFKYRGIDDVMNALHNAFADAGVFITTEVLDRKETERQSKSGGMLFYVTQTIRFNFHATDGSSVSSTVYGTAMDSGDKADNKGMSIGLKYALLQAFLIPTEDMAEPDSQTYEVKQEKPSLTPLLLQKVLSRIEGGDLTVSQKTLETFCVNSEQKEMILAAKPKSLSLPEIAKAKATGAITPEEADKLTAGLTQHTEQGKDATPADIVKPVKGKSAKTEGEPLIMQP